MLSPGYTLTENEMFTWTLWPFLVPWRLQHYWRYIQWHKRSFPGQVSSSFQGSKEAQEKGKREGDDGWKEMGHFRLPFPYRICIMNKPIYVCKYPPPAKVQVMTAGKVNAYNTRIGRVYSYLETNERRRKVILREGKTMEFHQRGKPINVKLIITKDMEHHLGY